MGLTFVIPSWSSGPHLPTASLTFRFLSLIQIRALNPELIARQPNLFPHYHCSAEVDMSGIHPHRSGNSNG